jgi:AraC family transcriptional regulator
LNSQLFEYFGAHHEIHTDHIVQKRDELIRLASRLYREMYTADQFSVLTVEGLMHELVAEFLRHTEKFSGGNAPAWLKTARDFISEEFSSPVRLSSIAELAGVHPTHLAREFHRRFHTTIGDFVRRRRVEKACESLRSASTPLGEVAIEAGFFDQSHFTRVFKKATGMTPGAYRRAFQSC